ncbi:hypothetical protein KCV01_g17089, partial [Aureobasidium melanogenum]
MLDEIPIEDQYVFTSLRYDGSMKRNAQNPVCCPDSKAAYLIKYHYERLVTAADHLGWYDTNKRLKGPVDLFNRIQTAVTEHKKKTGNKCPFKVRVCLPTSLPDHSGLGQIKSGGGVSNTHLQGRAGCFTNPDYDFHPC